MATTVPAAAAGAATPESAPPPAQQAKNEPMSLVGAIQVVHLATDKYNRPNVIDASRKVVKEEVPAETGEGEHKAEEEKKKLLKIAERVSLKKGEGIYRGDFIGAGKDKLVTLRDWDDNTLFEVMTQNRMRLQMLSESNQISSEDRTRYKEELDHLNTVYNTLEQRRDDIRYLRESKGIWKDVRTLWLRTHHRIYGEEWRIFHKASEASLALVYLQETRWLVEYAKANNKPLNEVAVEFGFLAPGTTIAGDQDLKRWQDLEKKLYKVITGNDKPWSKDDTVASFLDTSDAAFDPTVNPAPDPAHPDARGRNRLVVHNLMVRNLDNLLKARDYASFAAVPTPEGKLKLRIEAARLTLYGFLNGEGDKIVKEVAGEVRAEPSLQASLQSAEMSLRVETQNLTEEDKRANELAEAAARRKLDRARSDQQIIEAVMKDILGEGTADKQSLRDRIEHQENIQKQLESELTDNKYDDTILYYRTKLADLVRDFGVGDLDTIRKRMGDIDGEIKKLTDSDPDKATRVKLEGERNDLKAKMGPLVHYQSELDAWEAERAKIVKLKAQARTEEGTLKLRLVRYEKLYLGGEPADRNAFDYKTKLEVELENRIQAVETAETEYKTAQINSQGKKDKADIENDTQAANAIIGQGRLLLEKENFCEVMGEVNEGALKKEEDGVPSNGPEETREIIWGTHDEVAEKISLENRRRLLTDVEWVVVGARHYGLTRVPEINGIFEAIGFVKDAEIRLGRFRAAKDTYNPNSFTPPKDYDTREFEIEVELDTATREYSKRISTDLNKAIEKMKWEIAYAHSSQEHLGLVRAYIDHVTEKCRKAEPFKEVVYQTQEEEAKFAP